MRSRRLSTSLLAALFAGLILRGAYAYHAQSRGFIPTTSDNYETIALSLLERGEFALEPGKPTSHREPAYPLFIASVYALAGGRSPAALLGAQCLLNVQR